MAWNFNTWTSIESIKASEFSNGDVLTASYVNPLYQNVGYLKNALDDFKGKLVTSWSSNPLNTNFPAEKLVKDSLNTINNTITTFRNSVNSSLNSINKKLYNVNSDGDYYSYVENPDDGSGFSINSVDEFDGYKSTTRFYSNDVYFYFYDGNDLQHLVKSISLNYLDNSISEINDDITNIRAKFNTLTGNDIQEVTANADSITSTGLYAINFYLSNLLTVTHTAMLNITNLNSNYSVILNCGTTSSNYITEVFYSGTSNRITISVRSTSTITATITSCNKIAKI